MNICFFGIYNPSYSRNNILLTGLADAGAEIIHCGADWRDPLRYFKLWKSLRALRNQYDCIYAAYPSPVPTIIARLISKRPVVSDAFYSMNDAVVNERRENGCWHPTALKLLLIDWLGIMLAHLVITDTEEHKKYWSLWWGVNKTKIHPVYLGINNQHFHPLPVSQKDYFLVHFHGNFVPLQGVAKIIEAARLCANDQKIRFRLVGSGADSENVRKLAERYELRNVEFIGRVPLSELNVYMAEADVALGILGDTPKASRVIPNKVYEGMAAERAVITMDTPAVREIFSGGELLLVQNNPRSIADAIKMLSRNESMRANLAHKGFIAVQKYLPQSVAESLINILSKYVK